MRIIRTKIYRAFPELDSFDDERCERFVRAARRALGVRLAVFLLCVIVGVVVAVGPSIAVLFATRSARGAAYFDTYSLLYAVSITSIIASPVAGYLTRDLLLRRRVRYVLRARGVCMNCHYSLVGLPINAELMVTCPECQFISQVDEAMGELSVAADGTNVYTPSPANMNKPWLSEHARGKLRFLIRFILPSAALVLTVCWGGYEFFLQRQASAALALKPGLQGLLAYAESLQPVAASETQPDGWALYEKARASRESVDAILRASPPPLVDGKAVFPEFDVFPLPTDSESEVERERNKVQVSESLRYMQAYKQHQVWAAYDAIADARRSIMPIEFPAGRSAMDLTVSSFSAVRGNARMLNARMIDAAQRGDGVDVAAAFRTQLALARFTQSQPLLIQYLSGAAMESLAHAQLAKAMIANPAAFDAATLRRLLAAMKEQTWIAPAAHLFKIDELTSLDTIAWIYSDPSRVRFGKYSPALRRLVIIPGTSIFTNFSPPGSLGTLASTVKQLQERTQVWAKRSALSIQERVHSLPPLTSSNLLINLLGSSNEHILLSRDYLDLYRSGSWAMISVELFRRERGTVPDTLDQALAETGAFSVRDPFSGRPVCYKKIDAASDRLGRPYLLYSVGANFIDDGGATPPGNYVNFYALTTRAPVTPSLVGVPEKGGVDYIINDDR